MSREPIVYVPLNNLDLLPDENPCFYTPAGWTELDTQEGLTATALISVYSASFYDSFQNLPRRTRFIEAHDSVLLEKAQNGDSASASAFIANNLRLIGYLLSKGKYATRFHGLAKNQEAHDDICQLAVLGLYRSLASYDAAAGKFSTYADKALFSIIARAFQGGLYIQSNTPQSYGSLIRVPEHRRGFHAVNSYVQSKGAKATPSDEVSRADLKSSTNFTTVEIEQYFQDHWPISSLSESTKAEAVPDLAAETAIIAIESKLQWEDIKSWLKPRQLIILYFREVAELTQEEIGEKLGITRERIRQIYDQTIKDLRSNPAVVHGLDLPVLCDPNFPYTTKWRGASPCPLSSLPTPSQITERNGKIYREHKPQLGDMQIAWLPEDLKKVAEQDQQSVSRYMLSNWILTDV